MEETKIDITLDEHGACDISTPSIKGILKTISVIPETNQSLLLKCSDDYFTIISEADIRKERIFAPMIQPSTDDGQVFSQNCTEWTIGGPLSFHLEGGIGKKVKIIVRWVP